MVILHGSCFEQVPVSHIKAVLQPGHSSFRPNPDGAYCGLKPCNEREFVDGSYKQTDMVRPTKMGGGRRFIALCYVTVHMVQCIIASGGEITMCLHLHLHLII